MLTAALAVTVVVAGLAVWAWRHAERDLTASEKRADFHEARHREAESLVDALAAELDALSIAPPAAVAALQPDAEPPIPAAWLADLHAQPTTYDREYPR